MPRSYRWNTRRRPDWIYTGLMVLCVLAFWWFDHYYTPDPYGAPEGEGNTPFPEAFAPKAEDTEHIRHPHYELAYSELHEQAAWVGYTLRPGHLTRDDRKRPYFVEDPKVRTKSAGWWNYRGSGYNRGHLLPAGDRRFSEAAYKQTFYTSNISPQDPDFNAGAWNELEQQVRSWCREYGELYVITGGVLRDGLPAIGEEGVSVPEYFYKVVLRREGRDLEVAAFLMPNAPVTEPLEHFLVPIDRIEALSGLDFFSSYDPDRQDRLEAAVRPKAWSFR